MFKQLRSSRLLFWSIEALIAVAFVWICTKIGFLFGPIGTFVSTIFVPLLLAGALFYLLNPVVKLLEKIKLWHGKTVSRTWAVAIVFLLLLFLIFLGGLYLVPRLINQVGMLVNSIPDLTRESQKVLKEITSQPLMKKIDLSSYIQQFEGGMVKYAESFMAGLTASIGTVIGTVTSVTVVAITAPVMLFYMLKDSDKLLPAIRRMIPTKHADQTIDLLTKMSDTISHYVGGQVLECLFVGTFTALGYFFIGQKYALLLGIFAGVCNIIPYVGPYIGILPSLIVAFTISIQQIIFVVIVVIIVQQVDGNFIYPNIIGRSLKIHPLTIIVLLLAAGNIAGIFGMILVIPLYAVAKVLVEFVTNLWRLQYGTEGSTTTETPKEP